MISMASLLFAQSMVLRITHSVLNNLYPLMFDRSLRAVSQEPMLSVRGLRKSSLLTTMCRYGFTRTGPCRYYPSRLQQFPGSSGPSCITGLQG
jgi:hypothetical protein